MALGLYYKNQKPYARPDQNVLFIGKSHDTITRLALDDIHAGKSVVYIGNPTELLSHFPKRDADEKGPTGEEKVTLFDPARPFKFNVFSRVEDAEAYAKTQTTALKGMWGYGDNTPTLDMYLQTGMQTLIGVPETSLISLYYFLTDKKYRKRLLGHVSDPVLEKFWKTFETYSPKEQREETRSAVSKVWPFVLSSKLRNCLIQSDNLLTFEGITIIDLSKLSKETGSLIGVLILTKLYLSGKEVTLFVPDADRYGIAILSLILNSPIHAHFGVQYLDLLDERLRPAFLSSIPVVVAQRTSNKDARELDFGIGESDTQLYQLAENEAWVRDGGIERINLFPHSYPETDGRWIANVSRLYQTDPSVPEERLRKLLGG